VTPRVPEKGALSQNSRGPRTSHGVPDPHILSGPLSGEGTDTPAGGVPSRHVSAGAGTHAAAKLPRKDSPIYRIQYGRRKCVLPQQSPRRLLTGCTVDRALPRHTIQPLAPPTPRMSVCYASWTRRLAFAHHDAYAVDPTVYAATYTTSTGASPTGQVNPLLGQRVHRAMKHIRGEILNHCSTIKCLLRSILYIRVGPTCRGLNACVRVPLGYKRETPVREKKERSQQRPVPRRGRG